MKEVGELMSIDLLKQKQVWHDKMNQIKQMVDAEIRNRPKDLCTLWLKQINQEVYKALEIQYRMGLECINQNLPEISIELVLRKGSLDFRPNFDQLKMKYYSEIQNFISTPLKFYGVGGSGKTIEMF